MSAHRFIDALRGHDKPFRIVVEKYTDPGTVVVAAVAKERGLPTAMIYGARKFPELVDAREEVVARLTAMGWSQPTIGRLLKRDATSILNLQRRRKAREAAC